MYERQEAMGLDPSQIYGIVNAAIITEHKDILTKKNIV